MLMAGGYETLDISGDAGIRAFGSTLKELFINAATGMYSLMTDTGSIAETVTVEVSVKSHSLEGLLVSWLNELVFRFDAHGFTGKSFSIISFITGDKDAADADAFSLSATVAGETFDPRRHEGRLLIKAATYHNLQIENIDGVWTAEIIFDI